MAHKQSMNAEKHNKAIRDVRIRSSEVHGQKMSAVQEFRNHKNSLKNQHRAANED